MEVDSCSIIIKQMHTGNENAKEKINISEENSHFAVIFLRYLEMEHPFYSK